MDHSAFRRDLDLGDRSVEGIIWIHQTITFQSGVSPLPELPFSEAL